MLKTIPLLLTLLLFGLQLQSQNQPTPDEEMKSFVVRQDSSLPVVIYDQEYYDEALTLKKRGTVISTAGIGCIAIGSILFFQDNSYNNDLGGVLLLGGVVTSAIGIPQWITGSAKVNAYEEAQLKQQKKVSLNLEFTSNGLGLVMRL